MSTKDQRTINMVHYPLSDETDPRDLSEYLDDIDAAVAAGVAANVVGPASATNNAVALFDGTTGKLVKNSVVIVNSGAVSGVTTLTTSGAITQNGAAVPVPTQTDFISGIIQTVADRDYKIVVKLAHALTITETTTICASGTATFTFKINTTALGGTANSVSSSEQSQAHSSNNVAAADDDLVITASANSSCLFASFTIKFTKTLS